jgi:hypothetical protein
VHRFPIWKFASDPAWERWRKLNISPSCIPISTLGRLGLKPIPVLRTRIAPFAIAFARPPENAVLNGVTSSDIRLSFLHWRDQSYIILFYIVYANTDRRDGHRARVRYKQFFCDLFRTGEPALVIDGRKDHMRASISLINLFACVVTIVNVSTGSPISGAQLSYNPAKANIAPLRNAIL